MGSNAWLSEDATCDVSDPFTNDLPIEDWLSPGFIAQAETGFPGDFLSPLEGFGEGSGLNGPPSPSISEELDNFFEPSNQRVSSMRTAFSMNDLQSLQSGTTQFTPTWNQRIVSVKPSLESVPEGGPAQASSAVNLMPISSLYQQTQFQPPSLFNDGLEYLSSEALIDTMPSSAVPGKDTTSRQFFNEPVVPGFEQRPYGSDMMGPVQASAAHPAPSQHRQHNFASGPMSASAAAPVLLPPMNGMPMQTRPVNTAASGYVSMQSDSPEHHMTDAIKQEPGFETVSHGYTPHDQQQQQQQGRLQPSGPALRKSHSALELGAWRKMAAGDLDFVDPSGSVREQLQGLELSYQVGKLTPEERLQKILRYRAKRQMRNFNRTIKYQCRKSLADTRPRVRGRFARDNEPGSVLPHETKKAIREKVGGKGDKGGQMSPPPDAPAAAPAATAAADPTPAVKMEQGACLQAAPAATLQQQPLQNPTAAVASTMEFVAQETHATALAHLYNQWSETGNMMPQPNGELVQATSNTSA